MSGSVADEVIARYGASEQAVSQQVVAVLRAVEEVVQAQGLQLTPTSYFAAIMSALDKPETSQSSEVGTPGPTQLKQLVLHTARTAAADGTHAQLTSKQGRM